MYCLQCGKELPEGSKLCNECGSKQDTVLEKPDEPETTLFTHKGCMCEGMVKGWNRIKPMKKGNILLTNHKLSFEGFDIQISDISSAQEYIKKSMNNKTPVLVVHTKNRRLYSYIITSKLTSSFPLNRETRELLTILSGMI